jgi:hypothetical protein
MWYLYKEVVLKKDNLARRNWNEGKQCCFCDDNEKIKHLFFHCNYPNFVWGHYKKPVDLWHFSRDVLQKHHKHALSMTLIIFLSQISMLDTRHILFSDSSQSGPLYSDIFSHSSQMNKPFVTFYKICHGWRTNSPVSMVPPIIFCLRGTNISCWSYMSDLHQFFYYWNLILCHLGSPHDTFALGWPDETQKGVKMGFEPATTWSSKIFTTRLLLRLCWYVS